jgi:Fe-Mn family superoxide dismutase
MDLRTAVSLVESAQNTEKLVMRKLDYKLGDLAPCMSKHCVDVHYNQLTRKYFDKYAATGDLFQKAGAVLHNDYYWCMMQPYTKNQQPPAELEAAISQAHGSWTKFQQAVTEAAVSIQGNGWVLIMQDWQIQTVQNHIIKQNILWAVDVWEHGTVDWDYNREKFIEEYWNVVNWSAIGKALQS